MSVTDDMLMAYADGEFDRPEFAVERATVEAAVTANPKLARRVEQHRAMRRRLGTLYSDVLDEPIPERLLAAVRSTPAALGSATVTDMVELRSRRSAPAARNSFAGQSSRKFGSWGAVAASLIVGVILGRFALTRRGLEPISVDGGRLIAQSSLQKALTYQLASDQSPTGSVQIGLSFRAKSGEYCRTFLLQEEQPISGLACRQENVWHIEALALPDAGVTASGGYRLAGSDMPAALRAAVEEHIAGDPLDAKGELQAKRSNWK